MAPASRPPFDEVFNEEFGRFQQSYFEFWAKEFAIGNEKYMLDHPEVYALIVIFVCELLKTRPVEDIHVVAARHFTRPIEVLEQEVRKYLKLPPTGPFRASKFDKTKVKKLSTYVKLATDIRRFRSIANFTSLMVPKSEMDIEARPLETPPGSEVTSHEGRSSLGSDDVLRSSFLTLETSNSTLLSNQAIEETGPVTLTDHLDLWINKVLETAFLRTVASRDILIDGIYYIVQDCVYRAVDTVLAGVVQDISILVYSAYSQFEDQMEYKKRVINRQIDKTAMKAYRLRTGFRGYEKMLEDEKASTALTMTVSDITTVVQMRKSTYNRYEKDKFGVYTSNELTGYMDSITIAPKLEDEDGDEKSWRGSIKI